MARPATWKDLDDHLQRGDEIVRWDKYSIMGHPSLAKHVVAAAEAAQKAGLIVAPDGIYERPSGETLEERLAGAQTRWDELERKYNIAAEFGISKNDIWEVNNWARANGQPLLKAREEEPAF